ncbi:hypothetical protein C8J56DRAFT_398080 [Mycena floridula]|nr:hypothetical protein C8J56DRAFT_398080 [Mycena floridula]
MSNSQPNFGDTLTGGIQEVSALLPLLGTEQCERHAGSALDRGYIYAAATPLSIFGSLGIVKAAFSTLLGTITWPLNGARWLSDTGFGNSGSVASLLELIPDEGEAHRDPGSNGARSAKYVAEAKLIKLLDDQNIDDPQRVSVSFSGWTLYPMDPPSHGSTASSAASAASASASAASASASAASAASASAASLPPIDTWNLGTVCRDYLTRCCRD